ncbi:Efflux transporter, RND family, MFP subunit [Nitrospira japonica]|uniref:Efflux transporter, RND family, MFP subunit n=1 Tax=Nitrospira japonica TaxID=1325564 RepID=A0A1W1I738_9BACT|nr:efflux RND transporter periplasmic adaptor subunit [Nitrospira japonica]SLM48689.1 Efflux transporter, RND family, MFP subunit [Nitrospira japonica]
MARSRIPGFSPSGAVFLTIVGLAALGASGCERKDAVSALAPDVLVTEVVRRDVPIYAEGVGTTAGTIDAQIRAKVQGYLLTRNYVEGSYVKAGDLLFKIDARPYQASFDQLRGELARAEAAYKKTQMDVARDTPLAKQGAVSQKELDDSIQANEANKANVFSARANLEKGKLNLDWTSIASPVDGVAGVASAQIGDLIMENTVLTTVSQVDPIKVLFPISEKMYLRFAERIQKAVANPTGDQRSSAPLELILADGTVYAHKGKAALPDRQVDVKTGTITIVSYFPNPGNVLRPGQYAKVRAVVETVRDALLVPQRAVQELQGIYQVAVVDADNKIAVRSVKPGARIGSQWVITSGLNQGERVVVEGLQKVRSGLVVSPKPVPPEPASTDPDRQPAPPAAGT